MRFVIKVDDKMIKLISINFIKITNDKLGDFSIKLEKFLKNKKPLYHINYAESLLSEKLVSKNNFY